MAFGQALINIDFLPIEEGRIVNECSYIYEGSINKSNS